MQLFASSKYSDGFTLIELLVVIAIISLLSSVVLASLQGARERARITRMASDLRQFETGLTLWMDANRDTQWPTESELGLGTNPDLIVMADSTNLGDYLTSVPEPQFGVNQYRYDNDGDEFVCGGDVIDGVNIIVQGVPEDIAEELDRIIDGGSSVDFDCGKFTWRSNFDGQILFKVSNDGRL